MVSTPKAPDPVATAQAQAGFNQDAATASQISNMTNQVGPWGSTSYAQTSTGGYTNSQGQWVAIPQYTQYTTYSPEQQAIFDKTTAAQTNIADIASQQSASLKDYLGSSFNFNGGTQFSAPTATAPGSFNANPWQSTGSFNAPSYQNGQAFNAPSYQGAQSFSAPAYQNSADFSYGKGAYDPGTFSYGNQGQFSPQDFSFNNQDAANWSYDLASQRVLPQQQKDRSALETQLVNKGIRPGTAAWDSELTRLGQTQNDQLNQLALTGRQQAYGEALGTAQNNYGQQLGARQINANEALSAAQQNYTQGLGARQQNFNEAIGSAQQNYTQRSTDQTNAFNQAYTGWQGNANQSATDQMNRFGQLLNAQQQNYNQQTTDQTNRFNQGLAGWQANAAQSASDQTNAFNQSLQAWQGNANTSLAAQQAAYQQALAARQQNFQEAVTGRNQPINEITALLSGSQIANPNNGTSATPQTQVGGVDYTGLVNNNYNQQVASSNALMGGLFGLAGTGVNAASKAGVFSDRRVKRNIERVGTLDNGLPVYAYEYVWGGPRHIGVMAQDVEHVHPEAVSEVGGVKAVDYAMAVL